MHGRHPGAAKLATAGSLAASIFAAVVLLQSADIVVCREQNAALKYGGDAFASILAGIFMAGIIDVAPEIPKSLRSFRNAVLQKTVSAKRKNR